MNFVFHSHFTVALTTLMKSYLLRSVITFRWKFKKLFSSYITHCVYSTGFCCSFPLRFPPKTFPLPVLLVHLYCKTQNSGLRSKEEKPRDPIHQPSRCNAKEGLLSAAQTGDSDLLGGRAPRTANWASFLYAKKHTISILHTGYKVIGYTFAKQSYWYKLRGLLFKLKAILLVQTARAFVQT